MTMKKPKARDDYHIRAKRRKAATRQNWRCHWCGELMCTIPNCPHQATLDHLKPVHNGGTARSGNFVAACRKCNSERHPELETRKYVSTNLYATTGEVYTPSPFAVLKGLVT